ncbi:GNAT family N-acetyltransferase [bacterium]|nr:GNAT family N-acetyltransferase [bacterium]
MEIVDLSKETLGPYLVCLEDWSEDLKEAGNRKEIWYKRMKDKGLRVKMAVENGKALGMIQYVPIEAAFAEGRDLYFIHCIWVHGHKGKGVGNVQKRGIGKALLHAAEEDVRGMGKTGVAAWGVWLPFWMRASWFRKQGYTKVDRDGMAVLLWKPFSQDAVPPRWIRMKKKPDKGEGRVRVTALCSGWCQVQNMTCERARRASAAFGDKVEFCEVDTSDRATYLEWGIPDGLFIDGKSVVTGPPPSYQKIMKKIAKKVSKLKT